VERLSDLRVERDEAQAVVDQIGESSTVTVVDAADDWGRLTLDEQRAIIRAVGAEAVVMAHAGRRRWEATQVGSRSVSSVSNGCKTSIHGSACVRRSHSALPWHA
jgi:hypothetical protein